MYVNHRSYFRKEVWETRYISQRRSQRQRMEYRWFGISPCVGWTGRTSLLEFDDCAYGRRCLDYSSFWRRIFHFWLVAPWTGGHCAGLDDRWWGCWSRKGSLPEQ